MAKFLFGLLLMMVAIVSQFGAIITWFKGNDHAAIGWMLLATASIGYGNMLLKSGAEALRSSR